MEILLRIGLVILSILSSSFLLLFVDVLATKFDSGQIGCYVEMLVFVALCIALSSITYRTHVLIQKRRVTSMSGTAGGEREKNNGE